MMDEDIIEYVECVCHEKDHLMRLTCFVWQKNIHDVEVFFDIPIDTQSLSFRKRLKAAWDMILGRKIENFDTVTQLDYKGFKSLKNSIENIDKHIIEVTKNE